MGIEIERRFFVLNRRIDVNALVGNYIKQFYIGPGIRIRIELDLKGTYKSWITVKGPREGNIICDEYEYEIPYTDAIKMKSLAKGYTVNKVRCPLTFGGKEWYIDRFYDENAGLVFAEIELDRCDEWFDRPSWLGEETDISNYSLSINPMCFR